MLYLTFLKYLSMVLLISDIEASFFEQLHKFYYISISILFIYTFFQNIDFKIIPLSEFRNKQRINLLKSREIKTDMWLYFVPVLVLMIKLPSSQRHALFLCEYVEDCLMLCVRWMFVFVCFCWRANFTSISNTYPF